MISLAILASSQANPHMWNFELCIPYHRWGYQWQMFQQSDGLDVSSWVWQDLPGALWKSRRQNEFWKWGPLSCRTWHSMWNMQISSINCTSYNLWGMPDLRYQHRAHDSQSALFEVTQGCMHDWEWRSPDCRLLWEALLSLT